MDAPKTEPIMLSFRFDPQVLRKSMTLPRGSRAEGMWVEMVASVGPLQLGRLRNSPFDLPFRFNDWVVVDLQGDIAQGQRLSSGIPVLVYPGRRGLARITRDVQPLMPRLSKIATRATAQIQRELACACCGADNAMREDTPRGVWMVIPEAWAKVPPKFSRRVVCKACFTKLTGLNPSDPAIDAFAEEKHRTLVTQSGEGI